MINKISQCTSFMITGIYGDIVSTLIHPKMKNSALSLVWFHEKGLWFNENINNSQ